MNKKVLLVIALFVIAAGGFYYYFAVLSKTDTTPEPRSEQIVSDLPEGQDELMEEEDSFQAESWELVSGDPTNTCTTPTFVGRQQLKGWYVQEYREAYGTTATVFTVNANQLNRLPIDKLYNGTEPLEQYYYEYPKFNLVKVSNNLEKKLNNSSPNNPVIITATKFSQYCEGPANITVEE